MTASPRTFNSRGLDPNPSGSSRGVVSASRHASLISGHDSVGVTTGDGVADGVGIGVPLAGVAGTVGDAAGAGTAG